MSNVGNMRCDILDTTSWDTANWIQEQDFKNDPDCSISSTEYEETTYRKPNVGPYTVVVDAWGTMAVQTTSAQSIWLLNECDAIGVTSWSNTSIQTAYHGSRASTTDYGDLITNVYGSGVANFLPSSGACCENMDAGSSFIIGILAEILGKSVRCYGGVGLLFSLYCATAYDGFATLVEAANNAERNRGDGLHPPEYGPCWELGIQYYNIRINVDISGHRYNCQWRANS